MLIHKSKKRQLVAWLGTLNRVCGTIQRHAISIITFVISLLPDVVRPFNVLAPLPIIQKDAYFTTGPAGTDTADTLDHFNGLFIPNLLWSHT
jgi:hypothetical protein